MSPIDTSFLNPQTQKFLASLPRVDDYSQITPQMLRARPAFPFELPQLPVTVEKIQVPASTTDGHPIHIDVYRPEDAPSDAILPALIYL